MSDMIDPEFIRHAGHEQIKEYIDFCENSFYNHLTPVVNELAAGNAKIVSLAGPSCSGKTTCAGIISDMLSKLGKKVTPISTDDYFKAPNEAPLNADGTPNYEHFEHLEVELLTETLDRIRANKPFHFSKYDFMSGKRTTLPDEYFPAENEIFILEGIHALNDRLMASIGSTANIGVYISLYNGYNTDGKMLFSSRDIRFVRRLVRDYNYRSIDIDTTMKQWSNVIEGEELYIMPYIKNAKYTVSSYLPYEIFVLRDDALKLLSTVKSDSKYYFRAQSIIERLSPLPSIAKQYVPKNSILNEFIGK